MSKRRKKQENNYIVWGVILLIFVIVFVGGGVYYWHSSNKEQINKQTLCPVSGPVAHTVLLIDKTDPLNFTQKQALQVLINNLMDSQIDKGELVSVFALGEDFKENNETILEICNPGDGKDKSEWTANLKRLKTQYEDKFMAPILKITNELIDLEPAKKSPIMEQIQMVSINGFRKHNIQGKKSLIIVSDMLQNTDDFSMYKMPKLNYEAFEKQNYATKVQSHLDSVRVKIIYLMNNPKLQTRSNLLFWENFFNKANARIIEVRPLEG
ncbi:hypothetical protein BKK52_03250 [Rodentibacter trehalosifermentans]|uniref:VWFA domain-containing protein n=1 Tax=Rodentibacter trehalosifermentans TaxID=1908263 RepID=A0A1V3J353_9PAST|nr:hypothetical protein [Rodentibacter trehalosifermentans]OOF49543.1 hypothetical protein BKK52_03250 [Rodentibacter trehalosifermentans]